MTARRLLGVGLCACVWLAAPAPASGANRVWQNAEPLTTYTSWFETVDAVVAGDAVTIAAFSENPTDRFGGANAQVALKRPGHPLVRQMLDDGIGPYGVRVATDGDGNALVAWAKDREVKVARREPGGLFGAAEVIASDRDMVDIVANPRGDAALILGNTDGGVDETEIAFGSTTGAFSEPVFFSRDRNSETIHGSIEMAGNGEVIATWADSLLGGRLDVRATTRAAGEDDPGTQILSDTSRSAGPNSLAVAADGRAAVLWSDNNDAFVDGRTLISERGPDGLFGEAREMPYATNWLSAMAMTPSGEQLFVTSSGLWATGFGQTPQILNGSWQDSADAVEPATSGDHAVVVFRPDHDHAVSVRRAPDGSWGPVEDLRPGCEDVAMVRPLVGPNGQAAAVIYRRGEVALAIDAPSDRPGRQECVENDALYGRPARPPISPFYPTHDWEPTRQPATGTAAIGDILVERIRVRGSGRSRLVTLTVNCGVPCKVRASGLLRLRGGASLSRRAVRKNAARGRAKVSLRLTLSRRDLRAMKRAKRKPLQLALTITGVDRSGNHKVKKTTTRVRR